MYVLFYNHIIFGFYVMNSNIILHFMSQDLNLTNQKHFLSLFKVI